MEFVAGWLKDVGIEVKPKIVSEDSLTEIIGEGKFDMFEWGWVVEPDPNYQLSTFTCANRSYKDGGNIYANLSDSFYCDKQYDALYAQQAEQIDPARARRDRQADAEDASTTQRAVHRSRSTTTTWRPTGPTGSPASSRSPTRTARCCSSTAPTATRASGR